MKSVLILDDDENLAKSLADEFTDHGYNPTIAYGLADIDETPFNYAVVDIRLAAEFGLDAIDLIKEHSPSCRIVILTGYGSVATAVEAVKRGAVDYLMKPAGFPLIEASLLGKKQFDNKTLHPPTLSQAEHEYIDFVLTKNDGNISRAAKALGIHRQSLQRKLKKYT